MKVNEFCRNNYGAPDPGRHRLYGIEVEVENAGEVPTRQWLTRHGFRAVEDGSLRNGGMEFITDPSTMASNMKSYTALCKKARDLGYVTNHRTGIHVHVDMRDLECAQVAGVLAAYAAFEPLFFELVGRDREECIYCVPWYRATEQADIVEALTHNDIDPLGNACKYSALYIRPLITFGTIEFRAAPTWVDPEPMKQWMKAIARVVRWGKDRTPKQVLEECGTNTNPLVGQVFGRVFRDIPDPEAVMDEVDSLGTVEEMLPCTYKVGAWQPAKANGEARAVGYHRQARRAGMEMPEDRNEWIVIDDDVVDPRR